MDEILFSTLSMQAQAEFIQNHGKLIDAEDYYSYRILLYAIDNHHVELLYDFTNKIVSVEFVEEKQTEERLASQLESCLDEVFPTQRPHKFSLQLQKFFSTKSILLLLNLLGKTKAGTNR